MLGEAGGVGALYVGVPGEGVLVCVKVEDLRGFVVERNGIA